MAVVLTSFKDKTDYFATSETVFCSGYYDAGMHIGVAISIDARSGLHAVYGDMPPPDAHFCTPAHMGCAMFSFLQTFKLIASRMAPRAHLTVLTSNYHCKMIIGKWRRGQDVNLPWYDSRGKGLDGIPELARNVSPQLSVQYRSTREFGRMPVLLEAREGMRAILRPR